MDNTVLDNQKEECREIFLTKDKYLRDAIIAILTFLSLMAGIVAWSYMPIADISRLKEGQSTLKMQVKEIQNNFNKIDTKLDKILDKVDE